MIVKQDSISKALTLIAGAIVIYLSTAQLVLLIMFPGFLLIMGLVLNLYVSRRLAEDERITEEEAESIGKWTAIAMAGIVLGGLVGIKLFDFQELVRTFGLSAIQLSLFDVKLFSALMAIAEEQYFRGFFLNFFLQKFGRELSPIISGVVGTIYHLAVYRGSPSALVFVTIAFTTLSYVAMRTGRISPSILAHLINNVVVA